MHSKGDSLILTEDNKSDDQEWVSDQQEAGGYLGEIPLSGPTGHSLSRKRAFGMRGERGGVDIKAMWDSLLEIKPFFV